MDNILNIRSEMLETFVGATAFVATSIHATLCFTMFMKMTVRNGDAGRLLLVAFFISGLMMYTAWLLYLWHINSLFVKIGFGLQTLVHLVFLIQTIAFVKTREKKWHQPKSNL